jgi:hypothetical protein
MNTKKLVLSFCLLATVTGEFWGDVIHGNGSRLLTEAIPDDERRAKYEQALEATRQEIETDIAAFRGKYADEARFVRTALSKERRAYLISAVVAGRTRPIAVKVERLKCALKNAEKARDEARHFVWWKKVKVNRLTSKLKKAELQNTAIREKFADLERTADGLIVEAREAREQASNVHKERVEFVAGLRDVVVLRSARLDDDRRRLGDSGVTIRELEAMMGSVVQDIEYVVEQNLICDNVASFAKHIHDIDLNDDDYDYASFRDETGGGYWLYRKLKASFCGQTRGYNSDVETFVALLYASAALSTVNPFVVAEEVCNCLVKLRVNLALALCALVQQQQGVFDQ